VKGPQVTWTLIPESTMKFAAFMARTGAIKEGPKDCSERFFAELRGQPSS
jgi:hypothetical protein